MLKLLVSCSLLTIFISGCDLSNDDDLIKQHGFIYCGQDSSPSLLNPQLAETGQSIKTLAPQVFDSLLTLDPITYEPTANLASGWTVSDDNTKYTFTLRPDVQFQTTDWFTPSRGLTAEDVVFSFNRIINTDHPFYYVHGGYYPWFQSIGFANSIKSITAVDNYHVTFVLNHPDNTFLSNIATVFASIHSAEYGEQLVQSDAKNDIDLLPVGTGPFRLSSIENNEIIRLERNETYWNGLAKTQKVVFDFSTRGTGSLAKLLRNECDVISSPISSQLKAVEKNKSLKIQASSSLNISFLTVNTQHPALSDVHVRQALSYAINRQNILDSVYFGKGEVATSLLPPDTLGYQSNHQHIHYDRQKAIRLLRNAGYRTSKIRKKKYKNSLSLTLWVPISASSYNPNPHKVAQLLQSDFANIGVDLTVVMEDNFNRRNLTTQPNIDLILSGRSANNPEPDSLLNSLLSCNAKNADLNTAFWCNDKFDKLLIEARETNDPASRAVLYEDAQEIITTQLPLIPIANGVQYEIYHQSLIGLKLNPFNTISFKDIKRTPLTNSITRETGTAELDSRTQLPILSEPIQPNAIQPSAIQPKASKPDKVSTKPDTSLHNGYERQDSNEHLSGESE